MLENQYKQSEKRLTDQIAQLKKIINSKDDINTQITKQNVELKQLISKNEIEWRLKEHEYENVIKIKERKITELEESIKSITKEASEEFNKLSSQLDTFQNKIRSGSLMENEEYPQGENNSQLEEVHNNESIHTLDSSPYQVQSTNEGTANKKAYRQHNTQQ